MKSCSISNILRRYGVELYQGMATQTVHGVRQVAITPREPNSVTSNSLRIIYSERSLEDLDFKNGSIRINTSSLSTK